MEQRYDMSDFDAEVHPDLVTSLRIGHDWVPVKPGSIRVRHLSLGGSGISPHLRLGNAVGFVHAETSRPTMVLASEVRGVDWEGSSA